MYPYYHLPRRVMTLYTIAVVSYIALFTQVSADILVYRDEFPMVERAYDDVPARFGDSLPLTGLKGLVVYANPPNACSPIDPPPKPHGRLPAKQWIVLIRRCDCLFEDKVRNAQSANYSAAIVHNVNSSDLVISDKVPRFYGLVDQRTGFPPTTVCCRKPMSANNPDGIHIPSVFITEDAGEELRTRFLWNMGYYVIINDDLPFNINTHLLLPFAIVVGICFLIMLIFVIVKCVKDRRRQRRHRLPSSQLKKIPTSKFTKGDPYETCAICLEDYQVGEKLRLLPCSHAYHCKCIDPWLTRNRRVCPVCKRKVFADDERNTDSDSDTDTDDTSPLLAGNSSQNAGGGTFTPQQENPFQRAAREQISASTSSESSQSTSQRPDVIAHVVPSRSSLAARLKNLWDSISTTSSTSGSQYESPQVERRNMIHDGDDEYDDEDNSTFNFVSSGEHSINQHRFDQSGSQVALLGSQEEEAAGGGPSSTPASDKRPDVV